LVPVTTLMAARPAYSVVPARRARAAPPAETADAAEAAVGWAFRLAPPLAA
jgi:hypothetical protein